MPFPPTDWGDFTPEEYEVGAPATSNHFERWFRNVVAMAQRAPGAPKPIDDYEFISRTVITGSPTVVDFVFDPSPYDTIVFHLGNVLPVVNGATLWARFSSNSGASYDSGGSDYQSSATGGQIILSAASANSAGYGISGLVNVHNPAALLRTYLTCSTVGFQGGAINQFSSSALRTADAATNAVRILWNSGNFQNQGVITCYGGRTS